DRLRAQVAADRRTARPQQPARERRRFLAGGFAVASVAAVATTVGWLGWQHIQAQPVFQHAFSTRAGQLTSVTLPDGSTLRLDTATALQATFWRHRREVRLTEGQALFTVAADAARPFHVTAGGVRVTVVGTRFSVRLTPGIAGREGVEVEVAEGRVRVGADVSAGAPAPQDAAGQGQAFELAAGQRIVFDPQGRQPVLGTVAPEAVGGWRTLQLSFSDVPLRQALAEIERYRSLGIAAIDPAAAELRLSGTFDPRDPAATRRLLAASLPIRFAPQGSGWQVLAAAR
ncbi:MAG: FecR domain-containing protein, partial [Acidovorax sp.]|uniref:FecR family protein n=1 Tax=Acidovorax sp. TaxID=1872122 RepID=UPI0039E6B4F8